MAPPRLNNLTICFSGSFETPDADIKRWTEAQGGTYTKRMTDSVTHLVVNKSNWRNRTAEVKTALQNPSIKILGYEWFEDKLRMSGRISETKYLWATLDEEALKQAAKEAKAAEREKKRAEKEKEKKKKDAERIDWGGALLSHTNEVAGVSEDEDDDEESEEGEAEAHAEGAKTVKKKEKLVAEGHHIYVDQTGFKYDVVLIKTCIQLNRKERARIVVGSILLFLHLFSSPFILILTCSTQLYESDACPHTYNVAVKIGGFCLPDELKLDHSNESNFPTAFKMFQNNFLRLTGVEWVDRVKVFSETSSVVTSNPALSNTKVSAAGNIKNGSGKLKSITKSKAKAKGKADTTQEPTEPAPMTPEQLKQQCITAFTNAKYRYSLPAPPAPRGTLPNGAHHAYMAEYNLKPYAHQDNKSAYELFGASSDRGKAATKKREEVTSAAAASRKRKREEANMTEQQKVLKSKGQKIEMAILIESSDEEEESGIESSESELDLHLESETEEDEEDEDEEMEGEGEDGEEDAEAHNVFEGQVQHEQEDRAPAHSIFGGSANQYAIASNDSTAQIHGLDGQAAAAVDLRHQMQQIQEVAMLDSGAQV